MKGLRRFFTCPATWNFNAFLLLKLNCFLLSPITWHIPSFVTYLLWFCAFPLRLCKALYPGRTVEQSFDLSWKPYSTISHISQTGTGGPDWPDFKGRGGFSAERLASLVCTCMCVSHGPAVDQLCCSLSVQKASLESRCSYITHDKQTYAQCGVRKNMKNT